MAWAAIAPFAAALSPSVMSMIMGAFSKDKRYGSMQEAADMWTPQNYQNRFNQNLGFAYGSPMFRNIMQTQAAQAVKGNQQIQKQFGPRAGANVGVTYNTNSAPAMEMAWKQAAGMTDQQMGGRQQALMGFGGLPPTRQSQFYGAAANSFGNALPYIMNNWSKMFPQQQAPPTTTPQQFQQQPNYGLGNPNSFTQQMLMQLYGPMFGRR